MEGASGCNFRVSYSSVLDSRSFRQKISVNLVFSSDKHDLQGPKDGAVRIVSVFIIRIIAARCFAYLRSNFCAAPELLRLSARVGFTIFERGFYESLNGQEMYVDGLSLQGRTPYTVKYNAPGSSSTFLLSDPVSQTGIRESPRNSIGQTSSSSSVVVFGAGM